MMLELLNLKTELNIIKINYSQFIRKENETEWTQHTNNLANEQE